MFGYLRDWSFRPAHKPGQAILHLSENGLFSGFRFFATSRCKVLHAKPNTDFLEESRGRLATGKDPYEVVGDFLVLAVGERDLIADLVPEPHGRLDGAVASAHHKDFLVDVMVRLN